MKNDDEVTTVVRKGRHSEGDAARTDGRMDDRKIDIYTLKWVGTDTQTDRQTHRQTDGQRGGETGR